MESELIALETELKRIREAKQLALRQIDILLTEQKALVLKQETEVRLTRQKGERMAKLQASIENDTKLSIQNESIVSRSPDHSFLDTHEESELDALEDYLKNF